MKPCEHTGCKEMIDEKYHFCYAHFRGANTIKNVPETLPPGAWHADPVVDALLKINNNLSAMKRLLEKQSAPSSSATFRKGKLTDEDNEYISEDV